MYAKLSARELARIAVDKNELKVYSDGKIYLNNGTEFQIMLFNPEQSDILAKIYLNGKLISDSVSGLILRPGERVWLERYFDENRKFKFETYLADNSPEGRKATENNGLVKIEFYRELQTNFISSYTTFPSIGSSSGTGNWINFSQPIGTSGNDITYTSNFTCQDTKNISAKANSDSRQLLFDSFETGKIGKGNKSEQSFESSNQSFEFFPFKTIEYQLLPLSAKNFVSTKDLKIRYCDNCGKKIKNVKANYCSACGTKL